MASQDYKCKRCIDPHLASSSIHLAGPWVVQFGGLIEPHHHTNYVVFSRVLQAADEGGGANVDDLLCSSAKNKEHAVDCDYH